MKQQQGWAFSEVVGFADYNLMGPRAEEAAAKVRPIVEKIDLSGFPLKIELEVRVPWLPNEFSVNVVAKLEIKNRETREPCTLSVVRTVYALRAGGEASGELTEEHILAAIRSAVRGVLEHELDECFLFDGKRPFDPHAKEYIP